MPKDATINARIPQPLREQIDRQAARLRWKPSQILRLALEHYLPLLEVLPNKENNGERSS